MKWMAYSGLGSFGGSRSGRQTSQGFTPVVVDRSPEDAQNMARVSLLSARGREGQRPGVGPWRVSEEPSLTFFSDRLS